MQLNATAHNTAVPEDLYKMVIMRGLLLFPMNSLLSHSTPCFLCPRAAVTANVFKALYKVMSLIQNNTIMTLGQPDVLPGAKMCFNGTLNGTACMTPALLPAFNLQKV